MWQTLACGLLGIWLMVSTFMTWIPEGMNKTLIGMVVLLLGLSMSERWQSLMIASLGMWLSMTGIAHVLIGRATAMPHSLMLRVLCGNTHDLVIGGLVLVFSVWVNSFGKRKAEMDSK